MSEGPRDFRFPAPASVPAEPKAPAVSPAEDRPASEPESRPFGNEPGHEFVDAVKAPAPKKAAKKAKAKK